MALRDTSWITDSHAIVKNDDYETAPLTSITPGGVAQYTITSRSRVREWLALTKAAAVAYASDTANLSDSISLSAVEVSTQLGAYKVVERLETQTTTLDTIA